MMQRSTRRQRAAGPLDALDASRRATAAVVADLEADLAAIAESTEASPDDEHDAEGSTVGYERARVGALLEAARARLTGLERAVARGRRGEDARCERCGRPIDAERLDALPGTARCLPCAREASLVPPLGALRSRPSRANGGSTKRPR